MLDAYADLLTSGQLPSCHRLLKTAEKLRAEQKLRDRKNHFNLRPDVILYARTTSRAEEIARIQHQDVQAADLLLVVGTSMKVDGIQNMTDYSLKCEQETCGKKRRRFPILYTSTWS